MKEVLDYNYDRARERRLQTIKEFKKQQAINNVLTLLVGLYIIVITVLVLL